MRRLSVSLFALLLMASSLDGLAQRRTLGGGSIRPTSDMAIHTAGAKLLETELYELYEYLMYSGMWCDSRNGAHVSLVFKVDANYIITDDDSHKQRFEREILPAIKQRCNSVARVTIFNYIKGVRIDSLDSKEYANDDQGQTEAHLRL